MIQVEKLYCCSIKTASSFFACAIIVLQLSSLTLIIVEKTEVEVVGYYNFLDSDGALYSAVTMITMQILAAVSCYYGVLEMKPDFMIPIIVLIPVALVMEFIFLVIWFIWYSCLIFFSKVLIYTYVWVCFYTYWQQLRKSPVGLDIMNKTQ